MPPRYDREHEAALNSPVYKQGQARLEKAVLALRRKLRKRAASLRKQADKLRETAIELEAQASQSELSEGSVRDLTRELEEKIYWEARGTVGEFPRDENGDYLS